MQGWNKTKELNSAAILSSFVKKIGIVYSYFNQLNRYCILLEFLLQIFLR